MDSDRERFVKGNRWYLMECIFLLVDRSELWLEAMGFYIIYESDMTRIYHRSEIISSLQSN